MNNNIYKKLLVVSVLASSLTISGCVSTVNNSDEVTTQKNNNSSNEKKDNNDTSEDVNNPVDYDFNEDYVSSAQGFLNDFAEKFDVTHKESVTMGYSQTIYLDSIVEKSGKIPFFQVYHSMEYNYLIDLVNDLSDDLKSDLVIHIDDYNENIKEFFDYDELSNEKKILVYLANLNNHFFYEHTLDQRLGDSAVSESVNYDNLFDSSSFAFVNRNKIDIVLETVKSIKDYENKEDFLLHYYSGLQLAYVEDDNNWFVNPNSFIELSLMDNKPRL